MLPRIKWGEAMKAILVKKNIVHPAFSNPFSRQLVFQTCRCDGCNSLVWNGNAEEVLIRDGISKYAGCQRNPIWKRLSYYNWNRDLSLRGYGFSSFYWVSEAWDQGMLMLSILPVTHIIFTCCSRSTCCN